MLRTFLLFSFLADFLISYHIINLFSNSFQTDSDSVLHFGGHQLTSQDETIEENVTFKSGTIDDETMLHYEQTKKFVNIYHFVTRNFRTVKFSQIHISSDARPHKKPVT